MTEQIQGIQTVNKVLHGIEVFDHKMYRYLKNCVHVMTEQIQGIQRINEVLHDIEVFENCVHVGYPNSG